VYAWSGHGSIRFSACVALCGVCVRAFVCLSDEDHPALCWYLSLAVRRSQLRTSPLQLSAHRTGIPMGHPSVGVR